MRFNCPSNVLLQGLSVAVRALSTRSTQPIYEGIQLRTCDEGLRLTGSDGTISIVTTIPADVSEDGAVVLPGKLLYEIIRKMPDAELSASMNANFVVTFKCMGSRTTLSGQSAEYYPELPLVNADESFILPQIMLRNMIQQTSFAISSDESRMVLTGSLLELNHGEVRMVSLDGFRLGMRLERISGSAPDLNAIIPGKTLSEIAKIMSDDENQMAIILIGGNQMMITMGQTQFYSTLIEGEYIKYRQILPQDFKTRVKVSRDVLNMCVERASLMAREGKNNLIRMQIEDNSIIITANAESGDAYEEMEAEIEGEGLSIAFNVKYVSDVMKVVTDDEIYMCFNSGVSPCLIKPVEGDAFLYLVLPVRVNT
ncbi:DNA polymerase III subunit beta [Eubacteriales bacterium OttesenSCG-928-N13]|nr:DNA polymerase III subunit beta [Eubacteriales bacterium OttesenSCG-928-N13]